MPKSKMARKAATKDPVVDKALMAKLLRVEVIPLSITLLQHFNQVRRGDLFPITNGHHSILTNVSRVGRDRFIYYWHDGNRPRQGVIVDVYDVILFRKHETGVLQILAGTHVYPVIRFTDCYPSPAQQASFRA
jgi:hypothetical protein